MYLYVSEIFRTIQGESSRAGYPALFIRLSGCNLRCLYCDTRYAYSGGTAWAIPDILSLVRRYALPLVCITGGEPLCQSATFNLIAELVKEGCLVTFETNGSVLLPRNRSFVTVIDVKCPGSGEAAAFDHRNISRLQPGDEVKFVITDELDFRWAAAKTFEYRLAEKKVEILFSPAAGALSPRTLAEWILSAGLHVRLQLQLHRIIWPERTRGV